MPMIPFGLSAYSRAGNRLPRVRLVNLYAEETPSSPTGLVLLQRPGMVLTHTLSGAPRGLYSQDGVFGGVLFSVFGEQMYVGDDPVAVVGGSELVEWAYGADGLHLLSGGVIYLVTPDDATPEAFPDDAEVSSIASIDGILLATRADNGAVYFKLTGDTAWGPLDYFFGEREPDPAIAVRATADELWVFGSSSIEVFGTTGDATEPFSRIDGRGMQRGCRSRDSIVAMDNTLFWVGEDDIVYRGQGVPIRVSNHGIEEQIAASISVSAWRYVVAGHTFYVMNLDEQTLAYDASTDQWVQLKIYGQDRFGVLGLFTGAETYIGNGSSIYRMDVLQGEDYGQPIERIFTSAVPVDAPAVADALEVQVSPGTAAIGQVAVMQLRWSSDQGRTWTGWRETSLGTEGAYRTRARYRRLGMIDAPGRVFEHRITDPAIIRVTGVELNPSLGGRSR